jgi:hypothetical protein
MTPLDRAQVYLDIFYNAEDDWEHYTPDDAIVEGDTVWLGGVRLERGTDGWRLTEAAS